VNVPPTSDLRGLAIAAGLALSAFGTAEVLHRRGAAPEVTRKLAHSGGGVVSAAFPLCFASPISAGVMCAGFLLMLILTRRAGVLSSVHGVERESCGAWLFPVAVALVFALGLNHPFSYVAALLVLAISDALAAVVGQLAGRRRFCIWCHSKSLEGSLAFAVSAFVCVLLPLAVGRVAPLPTCLVLALIATAVATTTEAFAPPGTDNLLVPLSTLGTLVALAPGGLLAGAAGLL
jgi:phytol kinase